MVRKVILSMCLTMLATAAFAQEGRDASREAADPARDAHAQDAANARTSAVGGATSENTEARFITELAESQHASGAGQVGAKIMARQAGTDLPEAGVAAFKSDYLARRAQGLDADTALLQTIQQRNPSMSLEKFASKEEGCGE